MQKINYRAGIHIGEPAAEDDNILLKGCFVEMAAYEQLVNMDNSKCVLLGRTGAGKSALFRYIEERQERTIRVDPKEFAIDYIANSNVISYVINLGCDLHVLFEYLWKHVLLCKAVRCYFENRSAFTAVLDALIANPAATYFQKYQHQFWNDQHVRMREVSESFESSVNSELRGVLGADVAKIQAGVGAELKVTEEQKREIEYRVKRAVSGIQMRELQQAISALDEVAKAPQKNYFILIDDLDDDWAETRIKYQIIRSLMESVKAFRKLRHVKVLIALRSDVYEKSIFSIRGEGYQPEKYKGLLTQIRWQEGELREVIEKRVNEVFRNQYVKTAVKIADVLPPQMRKTEVLKYLIDRTLWRPRDIIAFFNEILDQAAGSSEITERRISVAEGEYSKNRYEALIREWESIHPNAGIYLRLLQGKTGKIAFSAFASKEMIDDLCLDLEEKAQEGRRLDEVEDQCRLYEKRQLESRRNRIASALLATLYKMGAIGLKPTKGDHIRHSYRDEPYILPEQISTDAVAEVVPMLWRTLGITPNIG